MFVLLLLQILLFPKNQIIQKDFSYNHLIRVLSKLYHYLNYKDSLNLFQN